MEMNPSRAASAATQSKEGQGNVSSLIDQAARRVSAKEARARVSRTAGQFVNSESHGGGSRWKPSRLLRYNRSAGIGLAFLVAATTITTRRRQNTALEDVATRLDDAETQRDVASQVIARTREHFTQSVDAISTELLATSKTDRPAHLRGWIHSCFDRSLASPVGEPAPNTSTNDK